MQTVISHSDAVRVDNTELRAAFLASGLSASLVAHRLGWYFHRGDHRHADGSRVKRALGLMDERGGEQRGPSPRRGARRRTVTLQMAVAIAEALDVDLRDVGL